MQAKVRHSCDVPLEAINSLSCFNNEVSKIAVVKVECDSPLEV